MQLLHVATFWLRLSSNVLLDLFLHRHVDLLGLARFAARSFLDSCSKISRVLGNFMAQSTRLFIARQSVFPSSVSSYSTLGGNSGCTVRLTSSFFSSVRSCCDSIRCEIPGTACSSSEKRH